MRTRVRYYGAAQRLDSDGVHYVDAEHPAVGWETWCVRAEDRVYAWEYATRDDGCDALYVRRRPREPIRRCVHTPLTHAGV